MIDLFPGYDDNALLTPSELARIVNVDPKTVTRWAKMDRIPSVKTPGGHRRFHVGTLRKIFTESN